MHPTPPQLRFALFESYRDRLVHAVFTRHGGVSLPPLDSLNVSYSVGDDPMAIAENRARCTAALGLQPGSITTAGLVHGARVADAAGSDSEPLPDGSRIVPDVDALTTDRPGQGLLITAADCLQVLLFDPQRPAVALAHAGWRGLVAGVLDASVAAMVDRYRSDPARLLAGIGPGLGPCCARFSDPARELPPHFQRFVQGQHLDLWAAADHQLRAAGIPPARIEQQAICTRCHRDIFFSHRGDGGKTGRFAAIIVLSTHPPQEPDPALISPNLTSQETYPKRTDSPPDSG